MYFKEQEFSDREYFRGWLLSRNYLIESAIQRVEELGQAFEIRHNMYECQGEKDLCFEELKGDVYG